MPVTTPRVSVVTPTYNRADMLGDAIGSVLAQSLSAWELVVVDDGSADNTPQLVASFADARIRYIYQENKGLPGARNTGIRAARGEYVAFLDSDDLFLTHKLQVQLDALEARPDLGLIAAGYQEVDRELRILREVQPWLGSPQLETSDWLRGCPVVTHSVLVRRAWLERVGLFDETMRYVEDWDLWLRLSHAGCHMDWLRQPVCLYRIHGTNMVRDVQPMKAGMLRMLDKFYAQPGLADAWQAMRPQAYATMHLNVAARALAGGLHEEAAASLAQAVAADAELGHADPPRYLQSLASFALSPWVEDARAFMKAVVQSLPAAGLPPYSLRKAYALLAAVAAFDYYQRREYRRVPGRVVSALLQDPEWRRNRGLLVVGVRSALRALSAS